MIYAPGIYSTIPQCPSQSLPMGVILWVLWMYHYGSFITNSMRNTGREQYSYKRQNMLPDIMVNVKLWNDYSQCWIFHNEFHVQINSMCRVHSNHKLYNVLLHLSNFIQSSTYCSSSFVFWVKYKWIFLNSSYNTLILIWIDHDIYKYLK